MSHEENQEARFKWLGKREKEGNPFYRTDEPEISEATRSLLRDYAGIPEEQQLAHITKQRDLAWEVWPYPCIGWFRFLEISIGQAAQLDEALARLKAGEKLLDVGCCFGQDVRLLVARGAPSANIYAMDLREEFTDLGYDLFRDKNTLQSKFLSGDIFDSTSPLKDLDGQIDMVHASSFFHLFPYEQQLEVGKRLVTLLKPKKGSLVFGRQVGFQVHQEVEGNLSRFRHSPETWAQLWHKIGEATGTKWRSVATIEISKDIHAFHGANEKGGWLKYGVWRE